MGHIALDWDLIATTSWVFHLVGSRVRSPILLRRGAAEKIAYNFHKLARHFGGETAASQDLDVSQNLDHLREDSAVARASKRRQSEEDQAFCAQWGIPYGEIQDTMLGLPPAGSVVAQPDAAMLQQDVGAKKRISLTKDPTICSCEYRHCEYRIRWSSLWGHETLYWACQHRAAPPRGLRHWDLRWSSLWGHETL